MTSPLRYPGSRLRITHYAANTDPLSWSSPCPTRPSLAAFATRRSCPQRRASRPSRRAAARSRRRELGHGLLLVRAERDCEKMADGARVRAAPAARVSRAQELVGPSSAPRVVDRRRRGRRRGAGHGIAAADTRAPLRREARARVGGGAVRVQRRGKAVASCSRAALTRRHDQETGDLLLAENDRVLVVERTSDEW
jgi:hypothetical protein